MVTVDDYILGNGALHDQFKHLRQFSLDRLKAGSAGKPTVSKHEQRGVRYDNEHDLEVNPWLI